MMYRLHIAKSLIDIEPVWRALEAADTATAFQSYRWLEAWARHVSPSRGETPLIVVGTETDGTPLFLLPLATQVRQGTTIAGWLGQSHATYAMGLYARGVAETLDPDRLRRLLTEVRQQVGGLSALHLRNQPSSWRGVTNPFAALDATPAANRSHVVSLTPGDPARIVARLGKSARGKLRRSAMRLAEQPGYRIATASSVRERRALLDVFLAQKARQFSARGIPNPFADPAIVAFYRELAAPRGTDPALLDCTALHIADDAVATATSISFNGCRHLLTLSLGETSAELLKLSPGLTLMQTLMEQASADGITEYDLGAGDGQHKSLWQPEPVALLDSYLPFTLGGYAVTLTATGSAAAKRLIKGNPRLWQAAQQARKLLRASGL